MTKIISYNVNGIRSAVRKGLLDWIDEQDADIVCLQETKAGSDAVPTLLIESLGYKHYWHPAHRRGYSGVATFTKVEPAKVFYGFGIDDFTVEGRVLRTDFQDWTLLNVYFPNGGSGEERQTFKMRFLDSFLASVQTLRESRPNVIVVGDYNIAHEKIDLNDPGRNKNTSGFKPEERAWMSDWVESGMIDSFRQLHKIEVSYTWWRVTQAARESNKGWRLDYQCVSDSIAHKITRVDHLHDAMHSDHCPVMMEIDL